MNGDYIWSFTTGSPAFPDIASVFPTTGATEVDLDVAPWFIMGEGADLDPDTLADGFTLATGATLVSGSATWDAETRKAVFTPTSELQSDTEYTATLAASLATTDGTTLGTPSHWSFRTRTQNTSTETITVTISSHTTGQTITGTRSIEVTAAVNSTDVVDTVSATLNGDAVTATLDGDVISVAVTLADRGNVITVRAETTDGASDEASVELHYPFATFADGLKAEYAIGQPSLTSNTSGNSLDKLDLPHGPALLLNDIFYVTDAFNNRILGFYNVPATFSATPDFVLGQTSLTGTAPGTSASHYNEPNSLSAGEGKVFVAEYANNRVLIYNSQPVTTGAAADIVVGQDNFAGGESACSATGMSTPWYAFAVDGKLIVADGGNHRVLIWNTIPTTDGAAADIVLGQSDMMNCGMPASPTQGSLASPRGIWSDGTRFFIVDGENRILIWDSFPTDSGQLPDAVLGAPDFTTVPGDFDPFFITSNGNQLIVGDLHSYQVLIWNSIPTSHVVPDQRLGSGSPGADAEAMASPLAAALYGDRMFVTDAGNHRILVFRAQ